MKNRKNLSALLALCFLFSAVPISLVQAKERIEQLPLKVYETAEEGNFVLDGKESTLQTIGKLELHGDMEQVEDEKGLIFHVNEGSLSLVYDVNLKKLETAKEKWHLHESKCKEVGEYELEEKIQLGAILVQTSLDGKSWITEKEILNAFSGKVDLNEPFHTIGDSGDLHLLNGCYFRIVVVRPMEIKTGTKTVGGKKLAIGDKDLGEYEYKSVTEICSFYAVNKSTADGERVTSEDEPRKEFSDTKYKMVVNSKNFDTKKATKVLDTDPHYGWSLGTFVINGYTEDITDPNTKDYIFLKTVGDNITLWFTLNQDITKLNKNEKLSIADSRKNTDLAFQLPTTNFKHGTLIVQYTDENDNIHDPVVYTDFLRASSSPNADTRIQLYEEGNYVVVLDYEINSRMDLSSKTSVSNAIKSHAYRVEFSFSIRNGNAMVFPKDAVTGSELREGGWTENGFILDYANSKSLTVSVERQAIKKQSDGTIKLDTRVNTFSKDKKTYTDEGVYTLTVENNYTNKTTTKELYVGENKYIKALASGFSVEELNRKIRSGWTVLNDGSLKAPAKEG